MKILFLNNYKNQKNVSSNKVFLFYQQNMLHAVSYGEKRWYAVDKTTGSLLYVKKFSSRQPFAINVYDAELQRYSYSKKFVTKWINV